MLASFGMTFHHKNLNIYSSFCWTLGAQNGLLWITDLESKNKVEGVI